MIPGSATPLFLSNQDTGYQIERSLRFNSADSAYLNRTPSSAGNRKTWTWSGWVKRSALGFQQSFFSAGTSDSFDFFISFESDNTCRVIQITSGTPTLLWKTSQVFRDVSAWAHFVIAVDTTQATSTDRVSMYINGSKITTFSTQTTPAQNTDFSVNATQIHGIGYRAASPGYAYFNGYLADVYFIDGQALDPTDFGEYDDNNVWQPKAYSGTYGTNGFHLPFNDNSSAAALGTDTSGNGNTWTVNNISVITGNGSYASDLTGNQTFAYPPLNAFNGVQPSSGADTSNFAQLQNSSGIITFAPSTAIPVSSTVSCWVSSNGYIQFNGQTSSTAGAGGAVVTITVSSATSISSSNTLVIKNTTYATNVGTVVVDGVMLIDNAAPSTAGNDSLVDSPTNGTQTDTGAGGEVVGNYATLNPLHALSTSSSFTNGNLEATVYGSSSRTRQVFSTINPTSGKFYFEITPTAIGTTMVGLFSPVSDSNVGTSRLAIYRSDRYIFKDGSSVGQVASTYAANDVIGVAYDIEGSEVKFYKNGTLDYTISSFTNSLAGAIPGFGCDSSTTSTFTTAVANFGQRPFAYTAPSGFKALCTTNLPDPTIADGSTAMDVALYTGNSSTQTISGLGFSPDLLWIKSRSAAYSHRLFDTIRGVSDALYPDLTEAEGAAQGTNENLTAFTSDGFSLGSTSGINAINNNNVTFAAWTWDGGSYPTNSSYNQTAKWSDDASGTLRSIVGNTHLGAFSGLENFNNLKEFTQIAGDNTWTFAPSGGISNVQGLKVLVYPRLGTLTLNVNGSQVTTNTGNSLNTVDLSSAFSTPGTLNNITITSSGSGSYWGIISVQVDTGSGYKILADPGVDTNGSIISITRANPSAGFSIVSYTGNGTAGATIGHGLNGPIGFMVIKNRDSAYQWLAWHESFNGNNYIPLNTTDAVQTNSAIWNGTSPSSSVITLGTNVSVNENTSDHIAYCFAPVDGYSAFGSYVGNGSSDGPMVFTNFRPRWVMVKCSSVSGASSNWVIHDTARNTFNVMDKILLPNLSNAELTDPDYSIDCVSNGFKIKTSNTNWNISAGTYIYAAFAESPFKTARAR